MDSFMQNHQSALDNQMEDNAIQDLQDAGIYPDPSTDKNVTSIADLSSYYFSSEEDLEEVSSLNNDQLKLWLIDKVLEGEIEVLQFFQEEN